MKFWSGFVLGTVFGAINIMLWPYLPVGELIFAGVVTLCWAICAAADDRVK